MSISELHPPSPGPPGPASVLAEASESLRQLEHLIWAARTDHDLVDTVEQVQALKSLLAAVETGAVAEAEARSLAKDTLHYPSTSSWLEHAGGLRRGDGNRLLARAEALTAPLTRTRQALAGGAISPEQADVIVKSIQALPSRPLVRGRGERALLEHAAALDATELARAGRHLVHVVDPDATDRRLERPWSGRNGPRTPTGTSRSSQTSSAGSGSAAAAASRTAPCSRPPSCP